MRFAEHWTWCTVDAIRDVAPDIREFLLRPDGQPAPYPPGSHIDVSLLIDGQPQRRSYSLVGERDGPAYRIAVRRAPDSRGGSHAMHALRPGARLEISNPSSLFDIDWTGRHYCLIAGGIGITPLVGIAGALRRRGINHHMHYAARSRPEAAYLGDLEAMLGDRLTTYAASEGQRLDLDVTIRALPADAIAIVCGPMRMLEAARKIWSDDRRAPVALRFETFGSSGLLPTAEFRIRFKNSDVEIVVPQNRSMLDALEDASQEIISDCRRGECGVCAIDVIAVEGEIDHRDVFFSDHEKKNARKICPCVSRARGIVTVDTLYRPDAA